MKSNLAPVNRFTGLALFVMSPLIIEFVYYNFYLSKQFEHMLSSDLHSTWLTPLTGRNMDLKDPQWHSFRSSIPLLVFTFSIFSLLRRATNDNQGHLGGALSVLFLLYIHRVDSLFLFFLFALNYFLVLVASRRSSLWFQPRYCRQLLWTINLLVLFLTKWKRNFLHPSAILDPLTPVWFQHHLSAVPWWISYNLTFLRLISFLEDSLESRNEKEASLLQVLFYLGFPPLFLTGPIMRFQDFRDQLNSSSESVIPKMELIFYSLRFGFLLLSFELFSTFVYATAIARNREIELPLNNLDEIKAVAHYSFASLFGAWFKFAIIWRFARLFAMVDGFNPPENMKGCIASTISFRVFWKEWHASFNAWLVRYMYIPLGGSRKGMGNQMVASFICFVFVACWHDLEWRMIIWGLGLSVALIPEIVAHHVANHAKWALDMQSRHPFAWNVLAGFFGAWAIIGLLFLNMFGYTLHDATWVLVRRIGETKDSYWFLGSWFCWMWVNAILKLQAQKREVLALSERKNEEKKQRVF